MLSLCISTDMTETQIPKKIIDAIAAVIPGLPDEVVKLVEDTLEVLGATTTDCHTAVRDVLSWVFCLVNFMFYFEK